MNTLSFIELKILVGEHLSSIYSADACLHIAKSIFSHFTGKTYREILTYDTSLRIEEANLPQLNTYLHALKEKTPLQYVLREAYFDGHPFYVDADVLIPRPETHELVSLVSRHIDDFAYPPHCMDMCTGSGCIGISLKKRHPHINVIGIDISERAIAIAQKNAQRLEADVRFEVCSVACCIPSQPIDILVSNPPYVTEQEYETLAEHVKKEPKMALVPPDGKALYFYERIALWGKQFLKNGGLIFFEINEAYGEVIAAMMKKNAYQQVGIHRDFYDKQRFISAKK